MLRKNAVVIVLARGYEHLNATLDSLLLQDYQQYEVKVFYDALNMNIAGILSRYNHGSLQGMGLPALDNKLTQAVIDRLDYSFITFVSDGTIFDSTWLSRCINTITNKYEAAVCNSVLLDHNGSVIKDNYPFLSLDAPMVASYFNHEVKLAPIVFTKSGYINIGVDLSSLVTYNPLAKPVAVVPDYLCGARTTSVEPLRSNLTVIRRFYWQAPLSTLLSTAAAYKEVSPQWEARYLALYISLLIDLVKHLRIFVAFKMLVMVVYKSGYRTKFKHYLKLGKTKRLRVALESINSMQGSSQ